jgi:hypothetical protein
MFTIEVDRNRGLLRIVLEGFMSMNEMTEFAEAHASAARDLDCAPGEHLTICDVTRCAIQPQDVAAELERLIVEAPRRARRLAVVVGDSPVRLQARRVVKREEAGLFVSVAEAEAWLLEGGAARASDGQASKTGELRAGDL